MQEALKAHDAWMEDVEAEELVDEEDVRHPPAAEQEARAARVHAKERVEDGHVPSAPRVRLRQVAHRRNA